jgi:hypothetical protein
MPIETAKNLSVGGVHTLVFHYGFSTFISIDLGEGSPTRPAFFFASVVSAIQIPERLLSKLAESVRLFECGEEALSELPELHGSLSEKLPALSVSKRVDIYVALELIFDGSTLS